jgi:hypothetical protein
MFIEARAAIVNLATLYRLEESPEGAEFFRPIQTSHGAQPASYNVYCVISYVISRGKAAPDVVLATHPNPDPMLKKSIDLPLFPFCAFIAVYRAKFTLIYMTYFL